MRTLPPWSREQGNTYQGYGSQERHCAPGGAGREDQLEQGDGVAHAFLETLERALSVVGSDKQTLAAQRRDRGTQQPPPAAGNGTPPDIADSE
jgi:hypothetical protein